MSGYNKELRDQIEQNLRIYVYPHFDSDDISCVLGEIDRLNKRKKRFDETGKMKILVACEFSGIVREAFAKHGHIAWSCDLLPTEIPGNHIQDDVLNHLDDGWDMMIAHPPCTRLANSGVRWLQERNLWAELELAAIFFNQLLHASIPLIAVENPIQHKYARQYIRKYDQIIQPWMFGHGETKATCLWLKGLPKLKPTQIVNGRNPRVYWETGWQPEEERKRNRSRTFQGIADAMADQWGTY